MYVSYVHEADKHRQAPAREMDTIHARPRGGKESGEVSYVLRPRLT